MGRKGLPDYNIKKVIIIIIISMPQLNYTRHGLTTYKKYEGMVAWGWDVPRIMVIYEVIYATKAKEVNID